MDKVNILSVLQEINAQHITVLSNNVQCACFLADWRRGHSYDSNHAGSMGIMVADDGPSWVHCFSCGYKGTLTNALAVYQRYSKKNIQELIDRVEKLEEQDLETIANSIPLYGVEKDKEESVKIFGQCILRMLFLPGRAHTSIVSRGFKPSLLQHWDVHYDLVRKRTVFPIRSKKFFPVGCGKSNLIGAVGRASSDSQKAKFFNYFGFNKSSYWFGENFSTGAPCGVLVEGILDTLAVFNEIYRHGLEHKFNVLGAMGSDISENQIAKLIEWFDEVVLFFDHDPAGWTCSRRLAQKIYKTLVVKAVKYPSMDKSDPAELIAKGVNIIPLLEDAPLVVL